MRQLRVNSHGRVDASYASGIDVEERSLPCATSAATVSSNYC